MKGLGPGYERWCQVGASGATATGKNRRVVWCTARVIQDRSASLLSLIGLLHLRAVIRTDYVQFNLDHSLSVVFRDYLMFDAHSPILIVDDCDEDYEIFGRAFSRAGVGNPLRRCVGERQFLEFLAAADSPYPLLILLDVNLPGAYGLDLLRILRGHGRFGAVPVIMVSTAANPHDVRESYALGGQGYVVKPVSLDSFEQMIANLCRYWLETVVLAEGDDFRSNRQDVLGYAQTG